MGAIVKRLKHAFAVDPPGPAEPTVEQQPAVDWLCLQIARRRLTTPGLIFLETFRPMNYLGSQAMHFFRPGVWALAADHTYAGYVNFTEYLGHRGSIDYLTRRIEHFETEMSRLQIEGVGVMEYIDRHMCQVRASAASLEQQIAPPRAESDKEER